MERVRADNEAARGATAPPEVPSPVSIEVRGEPGFDLKLESLENRPKGIEVASVRQEGDVQVAVVQIPQGALTHFIEICEEYLTKDTKGSAKTPSHPANQEFVDQIGGVKAATLRTFWTDDPADYPAQDAPFWWEVWVRSSEAWESFTALATTNRITPGQETITFPDRVVGLVYGTADQLAASAELLDLIAELRRAKEDPSFFIGMKSLFEQADWVNQFTPRVGTPGANPPYVSILDSGVILNPIIRMAIDPADCHRHDQSWPLTDSLTHGTEMAGVALFGDRLADHMASNDPVPLRHRLESVKILPPPHSSNKRRLWGSITSQAVNRLEVHAPNRRRAVCMAITCPEPNVGRPSSWSGKVDQICAGTDGGPPQIFFVSSGNTDPSVRHQYPDSNDLSPVQDPGQAWNAVTVGAWTDRVHYDQVKYPGHRPLAPSGDMSPCNSTSLTWDDGWPYKPDLVMEGGNEVLSTGGNATDTPDQMAMLTSAHSSIGNLFSYFRDTSAATAQAARMAALIWAEHPGYWPETVRALLIHSSEWTAKMTGFGGGGKTGIRQRLRRYGYGVPSLSRALESARDDLTLVVEQSIQPFDRVDGKRKTNAMGVHELPWPRAALEGLGDREVRLRVTLSYYVEPKPGRREGFPGSRHRYQSHGLRFEVRRPVESLEQFLKRVSQAAREEDETHQAVGDADGWAIGPKSRSLGSVHSDWWTGTAADLANCGTVAVFPVDGWWREARGDHWAKQARYALVVSLRVTGPATDLFTAAEADLYAPVEAQIAEEVVAAELGT